MEPNKAADTDDDDNIPLLEKPYTAEALAVTIRAILDAKP
jgi:hypothetical protein